MDEYSAYNAILKPILRDDLVLNKKYSSPLPGRRDSSPSFSVKKINGVLKWKDYGFPDATGDKLVNLVMHLHEPPLSFIEAKEILESRDYPTVAPKSIQVSEYRIKHSPLNYTEIQFWEQYHVTPQTLRKYKVRGLRKMYKDDRLVYSGSPMAFVYLGETPECYQIYSPKTSRPRKWMQFSQTPFILGLEQTPLTGNALVIVSGMKDGLCLYEATGLPWIAGCGETDTISIKKILPELKLRFRKIYTCLDPDEPGRRATEKFKEIGIPPYPFKYPNHKDDLADLSKSRGIYFLRQSLHIEN